MTKIIAVHGATGSQGAPVAAAFRAAGHDVRAVTRANGADLLDRASLDAAYAGADAVVLTAPGRLRRARARDGRQRRPRRRGRRRAPARPQHRRAGRRRERTGVPYHRRARDRAPRPTVPVVTRARADGVPGEPERAVVGPARRARRRGRLPGARARRRCRGSRPRTSASRPCARSRTASPGWFALPGVTYTGARAGGRARRGARRSSCAGSRSRRASSASACGRFLGDHAAEGTAAVYELMAAGPPPPAPDPRPRRSRRSGGSRAAPARGRRSVAWPRGAAWRETVDSPVRGEASSTETWDAFFSDFYLRAYVQDEADAQAEEDALAAARLAGVEAGADVIDVPVRLRAPHDRARPRRLPRRRRGPLADAAGRGPAPQRAASAGRSSPAPTIASCRSPTRRFDAALNLFTSLGYLGDEEDTKVLAEIRRVLQPGRQARARDDAPRPARQGLAGQRLDADGRGPPAARPAHLGPGHRRRADDPDADRRPGRARVAHVQRPHLHGHGAAADARRAPASPTPRPTARSRATRSRRRRASSSSPSGR